MDLDIFEYQVYPFLGVKESYAIRSVCKQWACLPAFDWNADIADVRFCTNYIFVSCNKETWDIKQHVDTIPVWLYSKMRVDRIIIESKTFLFAIEAISYILKFHVEPGEINITFKTSVDQVCARLKLFSDLMNQQLDETQGRRGNVLCTKYIEPGVQLHPGGKSCTVQWGVPMPLHLCRREFRLPDENFVDYPIIWRSPAPTVKQVRVHTPL